MWLLSAGKDPEQNVVIWDVATGTALTSGTTSQPVRALAWRPTTILPAFVTMSKVCSPAGLMLPQPQARTLWLSIHFGLVYTLLHHDESHSQHMPLLPRASFLNLVELER